MSSGRVKKIILVLLFIILTYIWGKNLYLFTGGGASEYPSNIESVPLSTENRESPSISYMPPQINPFRRPDVSVPAAVNKRQTPRKQIAPPPPNVSQLFVLSGVVNRPPNSQAVLRNADGTSLVISLGDSVDSWVLTTIASSYVIFTFEQHRDSLGLVD